MTFRIDNGSVRELQRALARLGSDGILEDCKPILQAAAKEIRAIERAEYRAMVEDRTGLLRKAIKVAKFKKKKGKWIRGGAAVDGKVVGQDDEGRRVVPAFYVHLVRLGFRHRRSGREIPGRDFGERAWKTVAPNTLQSLIRAIKRRLGL